MTTIAVPFEPLPVEKLALLVTACQQHRPWFSDADWAAGEPHRRELVIGRLAAWGSRSWEVYKEGDLVGLLYAEEIVEGQDCTGHFVFFDRSLADKRQLVINMMGRLFAEYKLHVIRTEIPTYAAKLVGFARKALGFRFESEGRSFSWPSSAEPLGADVARLGSRRHHAVLHNGVWCDMLLLSVTRDEYELWIGGQNVRTNGTRGTQGSLQPNPESDQTD